MTEQIEREEFARGHISPGEPPRAPRDASTFILARERGAGFEVLLLRRPSDARFAAGAYVFPGGTVDESDREPALLGLIPPELVEPEGSAFVAGLRELFEETGFLLHDGPVDARATREARTGLLAGESSFADFVLRSEVTFRSVRAAYHSRWITPTRFVRRYDTRFFLAAADLERPELTGELESWLWLPPAAALHRFDAGELPTLFPTRKTLEALARHTTLESAFAQCRETAVTPRLPRLLVTGDAVRPVLPGEAGYEEADS